MSNDSPHVDWNAGMPLFSDVFHVWRFLEGMFKGRFQETAARRFVLMTKGWFVPRELARSS